MRSHQGIVESAFRCSRVYLKVRVKFLEACFLHIISHRVHSDSWKPWHKKLQLLYNIRNAIIYNRFTWILDDIDNFFETSHPLLCLDNDPRFFSARNVPNFGPRSPLVLLPFAEWSGPPRFRVELRMVAEAVEKTEGLSQTVGFRRFSGIFEDWGGGIVAKKVVSSRKGLWKSWNLPNHLGHLTGRQLYWSPWWKQINPKILTGVESFCPVQGIYCQAQLLEFLASWLKPRENAAGNMMNRNRWRKSTIMTRPMSLTNFLSQKKWWQLFFFQLDTFLVIQRDGWALKSLTEGFWTTRHFCSCVVHIQSYQDLSGFREGSQHGF